MISNNQVAAGAAGFAGASASASASAGPAAGMIWGHDVARWLLDGARCPTCFVDMLGTGSCSNCASDFRGPAGAELARLSGLAAEAMRARQFALANVPRFDSTPNSAPNSNPAPTPAQARARWLAAGPGSGNATTPRVSASPVHVASPVPAAPALTPAPSASVSLQSVFAVAGAGLIAIAAIVFTFFNPDLSDKGLRSAIVGFVTLGFFGGALLLARRGLQFSAEAIGGLAVLFVGLDIWAITQWSPVGTNPWLLAAGATLAVATGLALAGKLFDVHVCTFGAAVSVTLVPVMIGFSTAAWYAAPLGFIGMAFVGFGAAERLRAVGRGHRAALGILTGLQIIAGFSAFTWTIPTLWVSVDLSHELLSCAILAALAVHAALAARQQIPSLWSLIAGTLAATSLGLAAALLLGAATNNRGIFESPWASTAFVMVAAGVVFAILLLPLPKHVSRAVTMIGALVMLSGALVVPVLTSLTWVFDALGAPLRLVTNMTNAVSAAPTVTLVGAWSAIVSLAIASACFIGMSALIRGNTPVSVLVRRDLPRIAGLSNSIAAVGIWLTTLIILAVATVPQDWAPARLAIPIAVAAAWGVGVTRFPEVRARLLRDHEALRLAAHVLLACAAIISWQDLEVAAVAGIGVLLALAVIAHASTADRSWHVAVGYAYGLALAAAMLAVLDARTPIELSGALQLNLVVSLGLVGALVATVFRVCQPHSWRAILIVTLAPFGIGIANVVVERSGWTALSTALMCALAFLLMTTRRPGLSDAVRSAAAAMLVPSLAVTIVCLGAQMLPGSASPVTLPLIALIVGVGLLLAAPTRGLLVRRGVATPVARAASLAIEISAFVTGAIAVLLALLREAAGLSTTLVVLLILGVAAMTVAKVADRRYLWWIAGACFTGALWCVWGLSNVVLLEAYLLPPTLSAAVVAAVLTVRGHAAEHLYAGWLGLAIVPVLMQFILDGNVWRGLGLLAGSLLLLAVGIWLRRGTRQAGRWSAIGVPTLLASMLAALAGPILGVRIGVELGTPGWQSADLQGSALFLACLAAAATGALFMGLAAARLPSRSRWLAAPAVLALFGGTWPGIEHDWFNIWAMWGLMWVGIAAVVLVAVSAVAVAHASAPRNAPGANSKRSPLESLGRSLPPVWFLFGVTLTTAIVAWSPRELRVEWFSLPLGLGLLAAGAIAAARLAAAGGASDTVALGSAPSRGTLADWPSGWSGSWAHLGPGLVVTFSASVIATFTDPQTWRAILVIIIALVAILVGAAFRLAAPFVLGVIVLPIENVIAFAVQIGRGIESMPWWITLAVVGAVLLTIAVTYERRAGEAETLVARLRDLR